MTSQRTATKRTSVRRSLSIDDGIEMRRQGKGGAKGRKNWTKENTECMIAVHAIYTYMHAYTHTYMHNSFSTV